MEDMHQGQSGPNIPPDGNGADAVFARRLRLLRTAAGLTQHQVAADMSAAGHQMHQTTIAKIEAGQRPVSVGEAAALARILGITVEALLTEPASADIYLARVEANAAERLVRELSAERQAVMARLAALDLELADARKRLAEATERHAPPPPLGPRRLT